MRTVILCFCLLPVLGFNQTNTFTIKKDKVVLLSQNNKEIRLTKDTVAINHYVLKQNRKPSKRDWEYVLPDSSTGLIYEQSISDWQKNTVVLDSIKHPNWDTEGISVTIIENATIQSFSLDNYLMDVEFGFLKDQKYSDIRRLLKAIQIVLKK